jgi:hypothetical protein
MPISRPTIRTLMAAVAIVAVVLAAFVDRDVDGVKVLLILSYLGWPVALAACLIALATRHP